MNKLLAALVATLFVSASFAQAAGSAPTQPAEKNAAAATGKAAAAGEMKKEDKTAGKPAKKAAKKKAKKMEKAA